MTAEWKATKFELGRIATLEWGAKRTDGSRSQCWTITSRYGLNPDAAFSATLDEPEKAKALAMAELRRALEAKVKKAEGELHAVFGGAPEVGEGQP
jgi:hypothetical protein